MVKLESVNKYFNKHKKNQIHVINNTSLEMEQTGLVALLGPSGCGKTTLLNAIGGLYKVNKGDTLFDIARRNNVNYRDLVLINGIKDGEYIYPNQEILIPKPDVGVYTVEDPETLAQVANKIGTTMQNIIEQNASIYLLPNQLILYKKEKYL